MTEYSDCYKGKGHRSDSVYILKAEMIEFAERLDGEWQIERYQKWLHIFWDEQFKD